MIKRTSTVGSRELKTRLGTYLERVRRGETILVTDRGTPVAELRPVALSDDPTEDALRRMAADGLLTRPTRPRGLTPFEPIELPQGIRASDLISRERDEGF
jgi:prevent-host-death family protein